jgi:predicted nucleic acid-binding protein
VATVGLDTSVVVRLLAGVPEGQARRAKERVEQALEAGDTILVTDLAIAEAYHALHHHYGMPKPQTRALLERFASSGIVRLDPESSLPALAPAIGAGLVDRLIHSRHRALAAVTLTFDRQHAQLEGAERLEAD